MPKNLPTKNKVEKIKTNPINEERMTFLRKRGYTLDSVFPDYDAEPLKKKLLSVGGVAVILLGKNGYDDYEDLVNNGLFMLWSNAKFWKLKIGQCHENVQYILGRYPHFKGYTGFALSEDGVWRYHSWAFDTVRNCILETTEARSVYYGIKY